MSSAVLIISRYLCINVNTLLELVSLNIGRTNSFFATFSGFSFFLFSNKYTIGCLGKYLFEKPLVWLNEQLRRIFVQTWSYKVGLEAFSKTNFAKIHFQ